ncbi:uncharacterized protein LOC127277926 [Leptopilina boulardi]|uniref:uncharacterized protein LOC127277926 n=1 Tax=Leptopilina boulardi TaxID=63433 RepID=UPI0021F65811|nr:uncharacterized protein LOC127277926 [Leptopilina boulardi]
MNRWKILVAGYTKERYRLKTYVPSGSAAQKAPTVEWPYFNDLNFLQKTIDHMGYVETFHKAPPHPYQEVKEVEVEEMAREEEDIFSSFPIPQISTSEIPTVRMPSASSSEDNLSGKRR